MSTIGSIHLFASSEFFYRLHSNPHKSVPLWADARGQIDQFFLDFHRQLLNRVRKQLYFKAFPLFSISRSFQGFSRKDQILLTGHYLTLCSDVTNQIESKLRERGVDEGLLILYDEITIFISLLNVIQKIVDPHGFFTHQDENIEHCNEERFQNVNITNTPCAQIKTNEGSSGKENTQFSKTKIVLELRTDRHGPRSISTSSTSGRSTPTDSGISSDDDIESKKEIEIESTSEDNFEAYSEEIHKMAIGTSDLPPFNDCDQILELLNKEKERRERPFEYFCEAEFTAEFPASSTVIDPSEFYRLDAYQKLLRRNQ